MRAVVIHHQGQRDFAGKLLIQPSQEFQKLLMPMALVTLSDYLAWEHFQGGEQSRCAIAFVVVSHRAATALLQRQAGWGAVQRLDLGLLIHAQNDRLLRRIQVQPHYIGQLLQEARVAGELESLDAMRLEIMTPPHRTDSGFADTQLRGPQLDSTLYSVQR
jgi:hypothetical protein